VSNSDGSRDLYKEAGVDVAKGDRLVDWLKDGEGSGKGARNPLGSVVSGIGGFAALFRPDFKGMSDPLLVSGTDGVGTKVLLGIETGILRGLGVDLVSMCVNDLYTIGARPLFFLDYYATGALDEEQFKAVLSGIKDGCAQCGAALMGGETAEMPGLYDKGHFDLAGFVVGVVDGKKVLGPDRVQVGDRLFALESSGFHSNGYSLVRHFLKQDKAPPSPALLDRLMAPTKIYHEIPALLDRLGVERFHALANITGGGLSGNVPRVLPAGVVAAIDKNALPVPGWMREFLAAHGTTPLEQEGVFNLGVGMLAVVAADATRAFEVEAKALGLNVHPLGAIERGDDPRAEATVRFR
jgi:phosphoribosylformylglycinamidine cyclo-ligase